MAEREHRHPLIPDFADNLFAGTAAWYAEFRPRYPQELLDRLLEVAPKTTARRRLVDLACGPGTVSLAIHDHFDFVVAVDLEPDMVDLGQDLALKVGAHNIEWVVTRAEDVDLPAESVDLVTIGNAFHRLDRPLVASRTLRWLRPGGVFGEVGTARG